MRGGGVGSSAFPCSLGTWFAHPHAEEMGIQVDTHFPLRIPWVYNFLAFTYSSVFVLFLYMEPSVICEKEWQPKTR